MSGSENLARRATELGLDEGRKKKEKPLNEKWGTEMHTAEKDVDKWKGWTIERLKARKEKLMKKEERTAAEQKEVKQLNFAIRAKQKDGKWGKIKEAQQQDVTEDSKTNKHKESKMRDAQMESWDRQLKTLLKEGLTITTSTGQPGGSDSVSVNATDADAQKLMKMLHNAGIYGSVGASMGMDDAEGTSGIAIDVEPMAQDEVLGQLHGSDDAGDDTLGFLKRMIGARSGEVEMQHGDYEQEQGHDHDHENEEIEVCDQCECDPCECDDEHDHDQEQDDKVVMVGEEEVEEGNEFTKARLDAIKQGKSSFKVGDKTYKVKGDTGDEKKQVGEEKETCNECGDIMEADHKCNEMANDDPATMESRKHKHTNQLDEWANSPAGKSEDEQFTTELDYMTKLIAGGLNGPKSDQTTLPHTQVKTELGNDVNVSDIMKKLAGIR
jgi:hypothetical protein